MNRGRARVAVAGTMQKAPVIEAVVAAVLVAVAFVNMAMVRYNYVMLEPMFVISELACALAASLGVQWLGMAKAERRGSAWASGYVQPDSGWLWMLLSNLLPALVRAVVLTAVLSVLNVVASEVWYRETVQMMPIAVLMRFLGDLPQAFAICLAVRLVRVWRTRS